MNIVIVCHYFYPEIGAPQARIFETAKVWVNLGHHVTVVTCFPNHPTGVIPEKYKGKFFSEEEVEGIKVLRNYVYATPNEGFFRKTLGHLSFMLSSVLFSLPRIKKTDVIIVSSPTYFSVFSAYFMSWFKRVPFVFEVRDLWPEAIVELGVLRNKAIIKILEFFEMCFYRKASKVVVVTNSFKSKLISRGVPSDKIHVITNGVDDKFFVLPREPEVRALRDQHGLLGKFVVLYVGAHGISHALEKIVDTADILRDKKDIHFLFVGEGAEKSKIIQKAKDLGLENVTFLSGQSKDTMPKIYALADVVLVPLKKIELFKEFIPSKIFEIMACEKPIIASVKGETRGILLRAGSALVSEPEDSLGIAQGIVKLKDDKTLRYKLGMNGQEFVKRYFTRQWLAEKYLSILQKRQNVKNFAMGGGEDVPLHEKSL